MPDTENMNQEAENELDDNQVEAEETDELEDDELFSDLDDDEDFADELDADDNGEDESDNQENDDALQNEESAEGEGDADTENETDEGTENAKADEEVKPTKTASGLERYKAFNARAKEQFKAKFGTEYDEFDDDHKDALHDIKQSLKKHDEAVEKAAPIFNKHGEKFAGFVNNRFLDLPARELAKVSNAEASGDFSLSLKYIEQFEKEYTTKAGAKEKAEKLNASARNGNQISTRQPPKTISSGTGSEPARRNKTVLTPEDLGFE
jgi:hypothetical protein